LGEAAAWYEARGAGLGARFLDAIEVALQEILRRPSAFPRIATVRPNRAVRRALVRRFPFVVIFFVEAERVRVVAVAHARRIPGYWLQRIPDRPS
jgi:plasmid stabilization system protein ParE